MPKRLAPPSDLPPDRWQELLAAVIEEQLEEGFDAEGTAIEAGLTDEETAIFLAWVRNIELQAEARRMSGELSPTTERMLAWMEKNPGKPFLEE